MGKIIAITSGKGGSGKTLLTAALGMALAEAGKKVCLADGCFGMRGLDISLGVQDKIVFDLADLCEQDCSMEQVLVKLRGGELYLAAAPQWDPDLADKQLSRALERLEKRFDYVLVDVPGILTPIAKRLLSLADEILLISLPGDEAARNTERTVAMIREECDLHISLIMNFFSKGLVTSGRVPPPDAISTYLDIPLMGILPFCEVIYNAAFEGRLLDEYPEKVRDAILRISRRLDGQSVPLKTYHARRLPWHS